MSAKNNVDRLGSYENPNTRNATYFLADDVDGSFLADFRYLEKPKHFGHLKKINNGFCLGLNRYNDKYVTREMARDHIEALSSQLDLTIRERTQARRYFLSLDREKLGLESSLVAYSVCCYVVEQNERNKQRRCHPNVPDEDRDNQFKQMEKSLNLGPRSVVKTYGKIQNRLELTIPPVREDFDSSDSYGEGGI
ncbi:hypothetical protein [Halorubrum sp. FL23]|uniref:hypothetical protein n=1 Tax=Halorubrum sp. FL23 TaxID=3458704 RepID=UPI004033D63F